MRSTALAALAAVLFAAPAAAQDQARAFEGGGITVAGWTGRIDAREAAAGQTLNNSPKAAPAHI